jgi:predicted transcriptional regulator
MTRPETTRLTIVLPHNVDARLRELAQQQGRSISNLAARILREALSDGGGDGPAQ